jgi:PAS domain S-box-containing protein
MDDGRLVRFDAVVHDITERKNTQIELEKANRELGMLFNNLDDVVYSVDMTTYRLIQISPACQAVYGYTPDDFFADGDLWNRVIHPDDKYILQEHYATIHRGEKLRNSYRIIHQDGSIRWIENSVIPTIDHSGRVIRLDGITRDITEKKAIQHDLEKTSEELNNLFHTIDEVIYSLDISTGLLTHMSPACEKLYGYPPADFYADPELWFKFTHPDDQERVAGYTALLAAGERIIDQCRVINRYNELRWVEYNIVPVLNDEGILIRIDGVTRDITEKKLSEQLLQKSEANLRAVFENTDNGYLLLDTELNIISFNHQVQRFAGKNLVRNFSESSYVLDYFAENRKPVLKTMMEKALSGENISYEVPYAHPDKLPTWYFIRMRGVRDGDGRMMGLTMSVTDISERKNNEENIKALNESLEAKVQERTAELEAFSYSVSHDLRAPLRIIHAYGQVLTEDCSDKLNEEDKDNLNVIMTTADKMCRLVDDLLNFSRLGRAAFEKRPVDMHEMVLAVVGEFCSGGVPIPPITIYDLPCTECDPNLTRQVWVNLISNAIKYSAKSSEPFVEIGSTDIDGHATYYVKDNGAGFDMKDASKLFGVFQRLHDTIDYEGTGVGLALSHRIVTRQGGRIWAEAKVNEGATFYFTLP